MLALAATFALAHVKLLTDLMFFHVHSIYYMVKQRERSAYLVSLKEYTG